MAQDDKGESSPGLPLRQQPRRHSQGDTAHLADPFLQPFLDPGFDPSDYLNATLDPLRVPGRPAQGAVPLAELSTQAQSLLSQLGAHTTRLTDSLTQLTDDIMRSGSRLAYEVELLRGETMGLAEALSEGLEDDVALFAPPSSGPSDGTAAKPASSDPSPPSDSDSARDPNSQRPPPLSSTTATAASEPPHIAQLRTLTLVRSRLDSVIKTFGDAMEFVFPPSELSVGSSFLSVSAPDPGSEVHSTEDKGRQVLQRLRDEIARSLDDREDPVRGIENAARRVEELKDLARVWRGTAEEKGRNKFVESLARSVEDRHRDLLREMEQQQPSSHSSRGAGDGRPAGSTGAEGGGDELAGGGGSDPAQENKGYGGYGLISQLQKLRSGL